VNAPTQKVASASRRAAFIDKDGTLVHNVPYDADPRRIVFTPFAIEGLRRLRDAGYALVIVTNQPGLGLGRFSQAAFDLYSHSLTQRLRAEGITLAALYYCPHRPSVSASALGCACRKPAPGLLQQAARELGVQLDRSWMIGDILDDVEAGARAGCRTVLLDVGNETEWRASPLRNATLRARDLLHAAEAILHYDCMAAAGEGGAANRLSA
jgi:histidinol-phosphate phosphatase family protein